MTSLRQRMINDMTVRGLAENTKKSYLSSVTGLACHYNRSPARISAQEVQDYLIFLHEERGVTWQSCNCARHGIRFFYRITLGLPDPHFYLPGAKTPSTLPELPRGFTRLRHYGLLANRCRVRKLDLCRALLRQPVPEPREPETAQEMMLRLTGIDITACQQCGRGTPRQILILEPQHRTVMRAMRTGPP